MSEEAKIGIRLLCCMAGAPAIVSGALAWWLRGRVIAYGPVGAFLPRFIRERI